MMKIILTLLLMSTSSSLLAKDKIDIWVDYDVSFGKIIRDVDDGYALITALRDDQLKIHGISYGFGNSKSLKFMKKITKRILKKTNSQHIKHYSGAQTRADIFKITAATKALAQSLSKTPLTIMAMGRLTNMASLIKNYPHLKSQIKEIIINAGRRLETETIIGRQRVIMPDTNIDDDLEAIRYVLNSGVKITMIPTEIMKDKFITRRHLKKMRRANSVSRWMAKNSSVWRFIWKLYPTTAGFIPWDVFIVTYITHPNDFYCDDDIPVKLTRLKNNTSSLFRKKYKKKYKEFLTASYNMQSPHKGKYCYRMKEDHLEKVVDSWLK